MLRARGITRLAPALVGLSLLGTGGPPRAARAPGPGPAVDFSVPPAVGLRFQVEETGTYEVEGQLRQANEPPTPLRCKSRARRTLTQTILAVKRGQVSRLERSYAAFVKESEAPPWRKEHPLAWRRLRATWTAGRLQVEVREDGGWKPAPPALRGRVSARELRHPILPVPAAVKRVGDRWELSPEAIADYFGDSFEEDPGETRIEGRARVLFAGFEGEAEDRCAVLEIRFDVRAIVRDYPDYRFRLTGRYAYHLKHRIVVSLRASGTMRAAGEIMRDGRRLRVDFQGTVDSRSRVKILATGRGRAQAAALGVPR